MKIKDFIVQNVNEADRESESCRQKKIDVKYYYRILNELLNGKHLY